MAHTERLNPLYQCHDKRPYRFKMDAEHRRDQPSAKWRMQGAGVSVPPLRCMARRTSVTQEEGVMRRRLVKH